MSSLPAAAALQLLLQHPSPACSQAGMGGCPVYPACSVLDIGGGEQHWLAASVCVCVCMYGVWMAGREGGWGML